MKTPLENLIVGPGSTRAILRDRAVRLLSLANPPHPFDLDGIHRELLRLGGYGGLDEVMVLTCLSLLMQHGYAWLVTVNRKAA